MRILTTLLAVIAVFITNAATYSGLVLDERNSPLPGALITINGSKAKVITDANGRFTIETDTAEPIIQVSYIGYTSTGIPANSDIWETGVVLKQENDPFTIGVNNISRETGAVVTIRPDNLTIGNNITAQNLLTGRIAGVSTISGTGAAGAAPEVIIRGRASISGDNTPLYVIDGVMMESYNTEASQNPLSIINPQDIESITVLKDAAAGAIYGSSALNGVVMINTKRGAERLTVNYAGTFSISTPTNKMKVLTAEQYRKYVKIPENAQLGNASTDWQDQVYRTAFSTNHHLSVAGKINSDIMKAPFRVAVGYNNQNGTIHTDKYERLTAVAAFTPSFLNEHLTFDININSAFAKNDITDNEVPRLAMQYNPTFPVYGGDPDGFGLGYYMQWDDKSDYPAYNQLCNPMALLNLQHAKNNIDQTMGNIGISYKIHGFESLSINTVFGYEYTKSGFKKIIENNSYMSMWDPKLQKGIGSGYSILQEEYSHRCDIFLNYSHTFGKRHLITAMAGYSNQESEYETHLKYYMTINTDQNTRFKSNYWLKSKVESFYGRLGYNLDNRLFIDAVIRADKYPYTTRKEEYEIFPAISAAWQIINNDEQSAVNLKLRAGFGITGSENRLASRYTTDINYNPFSEKTYNRLPSDEKLQKNRTFNAGIDFGFLKNRIFGSLDYYNRNSFNVIFYGGHTYQDDLPPTILLYFDNNGKVEANGMELSVNAVPYRTKDLTWTVGVNFAWEDCRILSLGKREFTFAGYDKYYSYGNSILINKPGEKPNTFYLYRQVYDKNGDPITDIYDGDEKKVTGKSAIPSTHLGINTSLSYRNWDFSISGHGAFGQYIYNNLDAYYLRYTTSYLSNILESNLNTKFRPDKFTPSDYFLENASYFKIDNITVGYTFTRLWNTRSSLRLTLEVQNLATITRYSGSDPETFDGLDSGSYRRPRTYTLGINLSF